jgi:ribosomal protein S18 acetylase RimI-like enzyme
MPVTLTAIESDALAEFLALIRPQYVDERMQADHLSRAEADRFVTTQWERTLPQGVATAGHHLFWAHDESHADRIGLLWISLDPQHAQAFIYEIIVFDAFRGRGLGRELLGRAEEFARTHRARAISLNVFSPNRRAIALYASAGFVAVSQHMSKEL